MLQGLGVNVDFYQERTKESDAFTVGGFAICMSYDWRMLGSTCGMEVDWVTGSDIVHVDMNLFSAKDWKFGWLLLIPFANYVKDLWR